MAKWQERENGRPKAFFSPPEASPLKLFFCSFPLCPFLLLTVHQFVPHAFSLGNVAQDAAKKKLR